MAAAASCHRQDVMGREQLNALAVSHTAEPSTGEALWDRAILSTLYFHADKQAAIGYWFVQATNSTRPVWLKSTHHNKHTFRCFGFSSNKKAGHICLQPLLCCTADTRDKTRFLFFPQMPHYLTHKKTHSSCSWQLSQNHNHIKVKGVLAERVPARTRSNTACGLSYHQSPVKPYLTSFLS